MTKEDRILAVVFFMPAVLILFGLIVYPVGYSVWLSLHEKSTLSQNTIFVGLKNFRYLLSSDEFWISLRNGVVFAGLTVLFQVIIGLAVALVLNESFAGRGLVRAIVFFPYVLPTIVTVMVWRWLLNDLYGVVNYLLLRFSLIETPIAWFGAPNRAMFTLICINVWKWFPFAVVAFLARLGAIPDEHFEAARVDGASVLQTFRYVTLPQLRTIIFIVVLIRGIWMFNKFDIIWLFTHGGPINATQHLPILAYMQGFTYYKMGMAATVSVAIFIILLVTTVIYLRVYRVQEAEY